MAWPLTFVEISDEELDWPAGRMLRHADAYLFVVEPRRLREHARATAVTTRALAHLVQHDVDLRRPAAIILSKADGLRYVPPIDRWVRRTSHPLHQELVDAECCDVFAYLHGTGEVDALAPYERFPRCTLHATGVSRHRPSEAWNGTPARRWTGDRDPGHARHP